MHKEPSADDPEVLRTTEAGLYALLTDPKAQRPWAVDELELNVSHPTEVNDALAGLHSSGLIHRCGKFVWATRAALAADRIEL